MRAVIAPSGSSQYITHARHGHPGIAAVADSSGFARTPDQGVRTLEHYGSAALLTQGLQRDHAVTLHF